MKEPINPLVAPWHRESYDRFWADTLPELLAKRFVLSNYAVEPTSAESLRVTVAVENSGHVRTAFYDVPRCYPEGWLTVPAPNGAGTVRRVVLPRASEENLEAAQIACVGEQLAAFVQEQLTAEQVGAGNSELRDLLPLGEWVSGFFAQSAPLEETNALAIHQNLRRLVIDGDVIGWHPSHRGRACPLETPEGPNLGRFVHIARGATIANGKLQIVDDTPGASFGLGASLIPFAHHSEPARTLMGANMMRQWHPLPNAEPPLVQTGNEPTPMPSGFWCGVNLLTAFVSWGVDTHEEALLLSETGAQKLGFPQPLTAGDKLSNRHGTKGVVSRILLDTEMPRLADGTPIELVYSLFGLPTRMNHGLLLEAALGRAAKADGLPAIAALFGGPTLSEIQARLEASSLPRTGMERLTNGATGEVCERESTVGFVYWGRTFHDAQSKLHANGTKEELRADGQPARFPGQQVRTSEYRLLVEAGAWHTIYAFFHEQNINQTNGGTFAPRFEHFSERLTTLGIRAEQSQNGVAFTFAEPTNGFELSEPIPHPWARERTLLRIGGGANVEILPEWNAARDASTRLWRILATNGPQTLQTSARQILRERVSRLADTLLSPDLFQPGNRVAFSGRAVIAPGADLEWDEVGLPPEMAWTLFGPLLVQNGEASGESVAARTPEATNALAARMAQTWVLLNRQPTLYPTSIVAFRARLLPEEYVVRLHPLVCPWFDADFDGDQASVFLPLSPEAQNEAQELLSVQGHLRRDPSLLSRPYAGLITGHAVLYGLTERSRTPEGRAEITAILGRKLAYTSGYLTREELVAALSVLLAEQGVEAALSTLSQLATFGFAAAQHSGASLGPFLHDAPSLAPAPEEDNVAEWEAWGDEITEQIAGDAHAGRFQGDGFGPVLLAAGSGARGRFLFLAKLLASVSPGVQRNDGGVLVPMRHGWIGGVSANELFIVAANTRRALLGLVQESSNPPTNAPGSTEGIIARALAHRRPGIVFAQAALHGTVDPLTNPDTRLFVGLTPFP